MVNRNMYNWEKKRWIGDIGAKFDLTSWLNVSGRIHYDRNKESGTQKFYASTIYLLAGPLGSYYENENKNTQVYSELLLNARKTMGGFSVDVALGSSLCDTKFDYDDQRGSLKVLNRFDLSALDEGYDIPYTHRNYHDRVASLFMLAQLGYKERLFLDLGGRMEWLKFWDDHDLHYTIQQTGMDLHFYDNSDSHFSADVIYPSVGVSVVPTGWLSAGSDRFLSFLKLNYTYSETGNRFSHSVYQKNVRQYPESCFVPERTKSHEIGLNAGLFNDRINLAFTMYKAYTPELLTGYADEKCDIYNKGLELVLGANVNIGQVRWNGCFTYSINQNEVNLLNEMIESISMFSSNGWYIPLKSGCSIGDIYTTDLRRDAHGKVIVDKNSQNMVSVGDYVYAGNADPKYTMGLTNNFAWKGLELDFVIYARIGGVGVSETQAWMDEYGVSKATAVARERGGVWVSGEQIPAKNYYQTVGGQHGAKSLYTYDATNVRLAELSLAYHIPVGRWVDWIRDVRVALVGRNLLMLYNKAPFDPESTASTGTWYQGIDSFRQPSYRNMGFSVNLTF